MRREFVVRYLTRLAVLAPFGAIVILIPPGPWFAKIGGMASLCVIVMVAQLAELALVIHNEERAAASDHPDAAPGSRRYRRYAAQESDVTEPPGPHEQA